MDVRDRILYGDALAVVKTMPDESVHACVTSPPYWSQRDYGTRIWFGGHPACDHDKDIVHGPIHPGQVSQSKSRKSTLMAEGDEIKEVHISRTQAVADGQTATTHSCSKCDAWYGQLGLEPTPACDQYRYDACGECYVCHMVDFFRDVRRVLRKDGTMWLNIGDTYATPVTAKRTGFLKAKDLCAIPWRLGMALQRDGWYLRNDCIWSKPSKNPESVRDRASRNHEYILMLSRSPKYYYDKTPLGDEDTVRREVRNSVWSIMPTTFKGKHFATFPEMLPTAATLVSTSDHGCCANCGKQYERVFDDGDTSFSWERRCQCESTEILPAIVFDPFTGSGTTLVAATLLGRSYVGIELNETDYAGIIEKNLDLARCKRGGNEETQANLDGWAPAEVPGYGLVSSSK